MANALIGLSADQLIAKGVAPVLRTYWKPVETRQEVAAVGGSEATGAGNRTDKKSKKQAKKVRA